MSKDDFAKVLKRELRAGLDDEQIERLQRRFSHHGKVAYLAFLHSLAPREDDGSWEVEEDLRWMIRRRFQYWVAGKLKEPFIHFTMSKRHYFNESDFCDGMRALGFRLPASEEHFLFRKVDLEGKGSVSYPVFITFVRDPNYPEVELKMVKKLRNLRVGLKEVRRVMKDMSSDDEDKPVSYRDFRKGLEQLGFNISARDYERVSARFDAKDDRKVDLELFYSFIKAYEEHSDDEDSDEEVS